ncbi:MAG: ABC transporter ATP-binding protein [Clostridiales bacterium]|nr:ABC transporter ATP-binding protein [Clostridiales bacterium]
MNKNMSFFRLFRAAAGLAPARFCGQYGLTLIRGGAAALAAWAMERVFAAALGLAEGAVGIRSALLAVGGLLLLHAVSEGASYGSIYLSQEYDTRAMQSRYSELHRRLGLLPAAAFDDPETLNRIDGAYLGGGQVRSVVHYVMEFFTFYLPYFAIYGVYLYRLCPLLLLVLPTVFVPTILAQLLKARVYDELEEQSAPIRRRQERCAAYVSEAGYAKETRLLGAVGFFLERYRAARQSLDRLLRRAKGRTLAVEAAAKLLSVLGYAGVIALLVASVFRGEIGISAFAAVFASVGTVMEYCGELVGDRLGSLTESYGELKQYFALFDMETEPAGQAVAEPGDVRLKKVSFAYPGQTGEVLREIDLTLKAGETVALVGENGSGKTTLTKLLLGLYRPARGELLRCGVPDAQADLPGLRARTSAVFQNYGRYRMTLGENLTLGSRQESGAAVEAMARAGLELRSELFPEGLDTLLSREFGGLDLSGGQWQRVAIARALLRDSQLLVLDEPTSAIDPMQEHQLYQTFLDAAAGRTAVIVTHRLGLARLCSRVVVLSGGRVAAVGTHEELLAACPYYAQQWQSQAGQLI